MKNPATTVADLHRNWAQVLEMCEGTKVHQNHCVKSEWVDNTGCDLDFNVGSPFDYSFAMGIVEDRPAFPGMIIYNKQTQQPCVIPHNDESIDYGWKDLTWSVPIVGKQPTTPTTHRDAWDRAAEYLYESTITPIMDELSETKEYLEISRTNLGHANACTATLTQAIKDHNKHVGEVIAAASLAPKVSMYGMGKTYAISEDTLNSFRIKASHNSKTTLKNPDAVMDVATRTVTEHNDSLPVDFDERVDGHELKQCISETAEEQMDIWRRRIMYG